MNSNLFASLLVIASAPVVEAPLGITLTAKGRQTLRAHNAPVPRVRARMEARDQRLTVARIDAEAADFRAEESRREEADVADSYPSDADMREMEANAEAAYNAQFPPFDPFADDLDRYPTLAERLAADLRYESKQG